MSNKAIDKIAKEGAQFLWRGFGKVLGHGGLFFGLHKLINAAGNIPGFNLIPHICKKFTAF